MEGTSTRRTLLKASPAGVPPVYVGLPVAVGKRIRVLFANGRPC